MEYNNFMNEDTSKTEKYMNEFRKGINHEGYLINRPEYWQNKLGYKSGKYAFAPPKTNSVTDFNQRSADSLKRIQERYGRPFRAPVSRVVDSRLNIHEI